MCIPGPRKPNSLVARWRIALLNLHIVGEKEQTVNLLQTSMFPSVGNWWLRFVVGLKCRSNYYAFLRKEMS